MLLFDEINQIFINLFHFGYFPINTRCIVILFNIILTLTF